MGQQIGMVRSAARQTFSKIVQLQKRAQNQLFQNEQLFTASRVIGFSARSGGNIDKTLNFLLGFQGKAERLADAAERINDSLGLTGLEREMRLTSYSIWGPSHVAQGNDPPALYRLDRLLSDLGHPAYGAHVMRTESNEPVLWYLGSPKTTLFDILTSDIFDLAVGPERGAVIRDNLDKIRCRIGLPIVEFLFG